MSQNVVVFFNKDVVIINLIMIAVLLMKIAFLGRECLLETVEVALQKLLGRWGGGGSMTACDFPGYYQQIPGNLKS